MASDDAGAARSGRGTRRQRPIRPQSGEALGEVSQMCRPASASCSRRRGSCLWPARSPRSPLKSAASTAVATARPRRPANPVQGRPSMPRSLAAAPGSEGNRRPGSRSRAARCTASPISSRARSPVPTVSRPGPSCRWPGSTSGGGRRQAARGRGLSGRRDRRRGVWIRRDRRDGNRYCRDPVLSLPGALPGAISHRPGPVFRNRLAPAAPRHARMARAAEVEARQVLSSS